MTSLARRLDPCANWFRLLARTRGRILWIFPTVLLGGYLLAVLSGSPVRGFLERASERSSHAAALAEARRLGLDFDRVLADPAAAAGKPVLWCVSSNDGEHGVVDSRATEPVAWDVPSPDLKTNSGISGYCWNELAVVVGVENGVVRLRPLERR